MFFQNSIRTRNRFYENSNEKRSKSNREWKIYIIQLSIAIMIYCMILLSRIVQSRKQAWIRKVKNFNAKFQKHAIQYNEKFTITTNNFNHSISLTFSAINVNYFKFRLFITVSTNQKRQNDWKNLRNLSKYSFKMNFRFFKSRKTTRKQRFQSIHSQFRTSNVKISKTFSKLNQIVITTKIRNSTF